MRLRCWVVVDMHYKPIPIIVAASANEDAMHNSANFKNGHTGLPSRSSRFRVFTASCEVSTS